MAVKSPVVVFILCLIGIGAAQQCVNITDLSILSTRSMPAADINTTIPFCFECPGSLQYFTLNGVVISNAPPDVVINLNTNTLVISNWSAVLVRLDRDNRIECTSGLFGADLFLGSFYSLIPEPLSLYETRVFYLEGTEVGVGCINSNIRPGYTGAAVWRNSDGNYVGIQGLSFTASRGLAGTYTCSVPAVPIIPPIIFEVVVYYAPEVAISTRSDRTEEVGRTFTLDCSYVGFPQPNVSWTLNGTVVDSSTDPDITVTTNESFTSGTSYLTRVNASSVTSRGRYYCILTNDAGSANHTFNVNFQIAKQVSSTEQTNSIQDFIHLGRTYDSCPSSEMLDEVRADTLQFLSSKFRVSTLGLLQNNPAGSCDEIFQGNPFSNDGLFWIRANSSIEQQNCMFV